MRCHRRLAILLVAVSLGGCYRTRYVNLLPPQALGNSTAKQGDGSAADPPRVRPSGWQHFFVWGWFPPEKVFRVDQECGGAAHVREIRTRQTFTEGLVALVAGYYVNVYSPYDAQIFCDGDIERP